MSADASYTVSSPPEPLPRVEQAPPPPPEPAPAPAPEPPPEPASAPPPQEPPVREEHLGNNVDVLA